MRITVCRLSRVHFARAFTAGIVLAIAALGCLAQGATAAEPNYYIADGKRIPLVTSNSYSAVAVRQGNGNLSALRSTARRYSLGLETRANLDKHGVVLVTKALNGRVVRAARPELGRLRGVENQVPVFKIGGVDQVLVNEFSVQFWDAVTLEQAKEVIGASATVAANAKIPNRYIVSYPQLEPTQALRRVNELNGNSLIEFAEPNFVRIVPSRPRPTTPAPPAVSPQGNAKQPGSDTQVVSPALAAGVRRASIPLAPPSGMHFPNDSLLGMQWALLNATTQGTDIGTSSLWPFQAAAGTAPVTIAIIDEGVDIQHEDLRDKIVTPYDALQQDDDQQPNEWDGHGTACAGIAAATTNNLLGVAGVAWHARILPVRIASSSVRDGDWETSNSIIEDGIRTAVDRGAQVLSNSWTVGGPSSAITSAIRYALSKNRVVVFAAGNDGIDEVSYPANLAATLPVIAVSAVNEWDEFKTQSSRDGEDNWGSNYGPEITLSAPGVRIATTDNSGVAGYVNGSYTGTFGGTSSATPFVAGAAAVLLTAHPGATPTQVRQWLMDGAYDLGPKGYDNRFGYGRLDLRGSLDVSNGVGALVTLDIPSTDRWLRRGDEWEVRASVTRRGRPVRGARVDFSTSSTLASLRPSSAVTDGTGNATVRIRGEAGWWPRSVDVTAESSGQPSEKKTVKVPLMPIWTMVLVIVAISASSSRIGRQRRGQR